MPAAMPMPMPVPAQANTPSNNLAMFAQMAQQPRPQAAQPQQMPPQGAPQGAHGMPTHPGGGLMPPGAHGAQRPPQFAPHPGMQPGQGQPGNKFTAEEMAALGRYGDSIIAHLTPGEIAVPPEVQTPKVLATLDKEFDKSGVDMQQFTAGSPQSSTNPQTGAYEYNFLSAILPMALGIAGSAILPGLGTGLSASLASAVGGGAGSALGGLISGQDPTQALLGGLGSGVGGYLLGGLGGGANAAAGTTGAAATPAANAAATQAGQTTADSLTNIAQAPGLPTPNMTPMPATLPSLSSAPAASMQDSWKTLYGALPDDMAINPMRMAGSALGGYIGNQMGAPTPQQKPNMPAGFNDRFPAVGDLKPWNEALGQSTYNGPTPNFNGYNAFDPMATAWDFYPQA